MIKNMIKKMMALLLAAAALVMLASCGAYTDEEANVIINELLTREAELNGYIYGDSFKTEEDPGDDVNSSYQKYYKVASDSKYLTLASLMAEVDALIVSSSRDGIYDYAFRGVSDNETNSYPARFAEDEDGNLEINVADHMYSGRTVALLNSADVKRSNETHIKAEITVFRFDAEGKAVKATKDVEIRCEDGVWRLVNQTMIVGVVETAP